MAWGLYSFGADHTRLVYMDFIAPDMFSPSSGSSVNEGVKPIRATTSSNSGVVRKNFSTVLQRVRGEGERSDAREADDVRPVNKSDDGSHSKEARGQDASPARTKQAATAPSHAEDESQSSNDESNTAEVSKTDPESAERESNAASDVQGQEPAPMSTPVLQTMPEAIGRTEGHPDGEVQREVEGEEEGRGNLLHSSDRHTTTSDGASKSPLISIATLDASAKVSDPAEDPSTPNKISTPSLGLPEQELDASAIQPKHDSQAAQVVKQSPYVITDDSGSEAVNLADNPTMPVESQLDSDPPTPDSAARRAFHAYLGAVSSNSKTEPSTSDSSKHEAVLQERPVSTQSNRYAQSLNEDQDTGVKTQWTLPYGQPGSSEWIERFSEFWNDQQSRQHDQTETKLSQAANVEQQVSSGQSTESITAGAHGRVGSSSSPPPFTAPFVSQAQPVMPGHDLAEKTAQVMARSVVLNVAQPDLGHVNIRVAMMNDVVHTHLSADRLEVGQFLINGQDRLQAALQANGLDMGQFRVDIDRQGAGRSFQHGPSQEQGQTWNQDSQRMKWERSPDRQDEQRASLHGLLNVMA